MNNLPEIYQEAGNLKEAEKIYRQELRTPGKKLVLLLNCPRF